ncbi:MAG TPA: phosphotransferase [Anaerolineales bacterium]|nr:phosphotransferase [Anaerolineales bacterium]
MPVPYKQTELDKPILDGIAAHLKNSLSAWYGRGARLDTDDPEFRSYKNSFILRYPVILASGSKKTVLVKIRRNPKMDSLSRAIATDLHANVPIEYRSLEFVYDRLAGKDEDLSVIRPLDYIEKYYAIVMEEYPSHPLRKILVDQRNGGNIHELMDAATKTGKWLHYFHQHVNTPQDVSFSNEDILTEVEHFARRLEKSSHGRVQAEEIINQFDQKLKHIHLNSMTFSQSHADMTCDNVLYSDDQKVCVIDIKTRLAPIYSDLGLILTHPETFKQQIFSAGRYLPASLLKIYREAILTGYFAGEPPEKFLVAIYSAIKVLDKWTMYEELMSRYKGMKHLLSIPVAPFVTAYFQNTFRKHLNMAKLNETRSEVSTVKPADPAR